jgi:hypothetical protein
MYRSLAQRRAELAAAEQKHVTSGLRFQRPPASRESSFAVVGTEDIALELDRPATRSSAGFSDSGCEIAINLSVCRDAADAEGGKAFESEQLWRVRTAGSTRRSEDSEGVPSDVV